MDRYKHGSDSDTDFTRSPRDERFYTPRLSARMGNSSSDGEWATPRSAVGVGWASDEGEYSTPREAGFYQPQPHDPFAQAKHGQPYDVKYGPPDDQWGYGPAGHPQAEPKAFRPPQQHYHPHPPEQPPYADAHHRHPMTSPMVGAAPHQAPSYPDGHQYRPGGEPYGPPQGSEWRQPSYDKAPQQAYYPPQEQLHRHPQSHPQYHHQPTPSTYHHVTHQSPPPTYQQPPPTYQQPPPTYQHPPPTYQQPPPMYQQPPSQEYRAPPATYHEPTREPPPGHAASPDAREYYQQREYRRGEAAEQAVEWHHADSAGYHSEATSGYHSDGPRGAKDDGVPISAGEDMDQAVEDIFSFARHNRVEDVERLLDRGVPVNVRDQFGNTILAISCQNGNKRVAKSALRRGADINAKNYKGNTPLHFCFTYGYGDSLGQYMISKGADPAIRNMAGLSCYEGLGR